MYSGSRVGQATIVCDCWRKPRKLVDISQHRKKVIQKICLGKNELWAEKRETHINCRIYSGAGSFALNLSPGPLARNLKMIFPAMWWGLKWDCWCEGMAVGLIVIDVDWQIWVLFLSVFSLLSSCTSNNFGLIDSVNLRHLTTHPQKEIFEFMFYE